MVLRKDKHAEKTSEIFATSQQTRFNPLQSNATEIDLTAVTISIGEREVLTDARLRLKNGGRYGLVGKNGCGKSTIVEKRIPGIPPGLRIHLVSQIQGDDRTEEGETALEHVLRGHVERARALKEREDLSKVIESKADEAARLFHQIMVKRAEEHLVEARKIALLRSGARGKDARADEIEAEQDLEDLTSKTGGLALDVDVQTRAAEMLLDVQTTLDLLESDTTEAQATRILRGLGFSESMVNAPFSSLSGGWRSRCRLATALLVQTDLLLLDEPSNFMDLKSVLWLESFLRTSTNFSTLILTSHDQVFLDRMAEQTIALRNQQLDYFDGCPSLMQRTEAEERCAKAKVIQAMEKKREHIESSITEGRKAAKANNDDNRMRMVKSRQKKLDDRWGLETSAKGTRFKLNRDMAGYFLTSREEMSLEREERDARWRLIQPEAVKGSLVSLEDVSVGYGRKVVLEGVNLVIHPGSRMAIVGSNGQGKSTLAKAITGELKASKGVITTSPQLKLGYFSQHAVESLPLGSEHTALTYFMEMMDVKEMPSRAFLGGLGLQGKVASHTPVANLSGGQKVRLALSTILYKAPNLLLLDEVTTHLDVPTIRALARALRSYEGAVVLVTHDRWFSSVVVEGQSVTEDESGSESSGEEQPGQTLFVSKGKVRKIGGMTDYERIMEKRLNKRTV